MQKLGARVFLLVAAFVLVLLWPFGVAFGLLGAWMANEPLALVWRDSRNMATDWWAAMRTPTAKGF